MTFNFRINLPWLIPVRETAMIFQLVQFYSQIFYHVYSLNWRCRFSPFLYSKLLSFIKIIIHNIFFLPFTWRFYKDIYQLVLSVLFFQFSFIRMCIYIGSWIISLCIGRLTVLDNYWRCTWLNQHWPRRNFNPPLSSQICEVIQENI